jgi:class 3 adenylate cyclase/tetratricopeptide (TPR) repeat protein
LAAGGFPISLRSVNCPNCGAENPAGQRFCGSCGTALAQTCGSCGTANPPGQRFCGTCGTALGATTPAATGRPAVIPAAERRLVSVLFADLVGFTTLSESRDAEDVRELLSRYFDRCRRLIELYGGTVEKFIGDAVMAVWGTPIATEDDAERAVRAALDLVTAVSALGEELGAENLRARAGVLTGEAAVTLGATGQGMVAGDLVNTASRVQSVAEPGAVFVGEATKRASEQTIVFEDAGDFELKGKEGETRLWRALRVVSGRSGSLKSAGLEAPFVGRDRELRQIKELFHTSADERRTQLVSVTGIAGIGKSRLAWEFYKYFDGIEQVVYWHRGRCLAYGDGVAFWALADMVRMRCEIAEDDEQAVALEKLRGALEEYMLDPEERRFVEPRLAQLLGIGEHDQRDRQDLFSAWRLFFERLADVYPTVLAFEDMQWADTALLDFVEYLLEWSRDSPLFVITLARPDLLDRRPTWGAGQRNFTSIYLEPLSHAAMGELLAGLVPGLPTTLRDRILDRAEGVPLYAVETVRMLLDRGVLAQDGSSYRVVGEVDSLDVPETLQAVAAARLDSLTAEERRVVQDAAVLGKTFSPGALAALTGKTDEELTPLLSGLVRKELLGTQMDPRSPERGQYGFLQDLIRQVAYDTLSKRDRRAKHLAAAAVLTASLVEEEVAEVIASHLVEAYRLDPDSDDADELRQRARRALANAGERVAALGAPAEALRFFCDAAELTEGAEDQAGLLLRAGEMAQEEGLAEHARDLFERARDLLTQAGKLHAACRATSWMALVDQMTGNSAAAIALMEDAYSAVADDEPDADIGVLLGRLGQTLAFAGVSERAAEILDRVLDIGEALQDPDLLIRGWQAKSILLQSTRPIEVRALLRLAMNTALETERWRFASNAATSLSDCAFQADRPREALEYLEQAEGLSERVGSRTGQAFVLSERTYALTLLGRWDEALATFGELSPDLVGTANILSPATGVLEIYLRRGDLGAAEALIQRYERLGNSVDMQAKGCYYAAVSATAAARGTHRDALAAAQIVIDGASVMGLGAQDVKQAMRHALESAVALGEEEAVERLLATIDGAAPGLRPPFLAALANRFRALLAGDLPAADRHYATALEQFRSLELPFDEAVVSLEYAEWLERIGRPGEAAPLRESSREIFESLRATPWLARAEAAGVVHA